jgi:hypothetical protein
MLRSLWDVAAPLARGELVQVLPGWAMLDADVHLVLPPRPPGLALPRRVQLLQQHLVQAFAGEPWQTRINAAIKPPPVAPATSPPARRRPR